jgi:hypothetical protein
MNNKLNILWTTDNRDTVFNMLSMYAINSVNKGWWEHVNIILQSNTYYHALKAY